MTIGGSKDETADRLRALTNPQSVALVGVSSDPGHVTARPLRFLQRHGFGGRIFPINRSNDRVQGLQAYGSIDDVPAAVDHAYILLGRDSAIDALTGCADKGVKVVSILADGFAEAGDEGRRRQSRLQAIADEANITLIGPNSMGVADTRYGFICTTNAAFAAPDILAGRFSVLSQSGSLIGAIASRGAAVGIGFSTFVSLGNEARDDISSIGHLLLDDPETDAILLAIETIRDAVAFAEFARAAYQKSKPIVAFIYASSPEGKFLASSHTGAMVGSTQAMQALMLDCGVHVVEVFDALFEAPAAILAVRGKRHRRPKSATVVSTTGGGGAMVIDRLSLRSIPVSSCPRGTQNRLSSAGIRIPSGKLIDVTLAGARYETMYKVMDAITQDNDVGLVIAAIGSSAQFNPDLAVKPVIDVALAPGNRAPVFAFPVPEASEAVRELNRRGVPAFRTLESCVDTVSAIVRTPPPKMASTTSLSVDTINLLSREGADVFSEVAAYEVFETLGIRSCERVLLSISEALPSPLPFAYPVVAKLHTPHVAHKSDLDAVKVNLSSHEALSTAIEELRKVAKNHGHDGRETGILVQPMVFGLAEVLVGLSRDPIAGPLVSVGMGGTLAEIYNDVSTRRAPVDRATALEMLNEVRAFALLRGYRNGPEGDVGALADTVAAISTLAAAANVVEAEINPLIVHPKGQGVTMVDALIKSVSDRNDV